MNVDDYLKSIKPAAQRSALAPFHADVMKLRASGCTLDQIAEFLRVNGVTVTLSTVAKYLRKHDAVSDATSVTQHAPATPTVVVAPVARSKKVASGDGQAVQRKTSETRDPSSISATLDPPGFKSVEQLREENPTLTSVQIHKLYAQQYAGPAFDSAQLEDMKRRYAPQSHKG